MNVLHAHIPPHTHDDQGKRVTAIYWGSSGLLLFGLAQAPPGLYRPHTMHVISVLRFLTNSAALDTSTPPLATLYRSPIGADCRVLHSAAAVHD